MAGINAERVIALVTDAQMRRDWSAMQLPREPMRLPPLRSRRARMAEGDLPVAGDDAAGPLPALPQLRAMRRNGSVLIDLRPEPFYDAELSTPRDRAPAKVGRSPHRFAVINPHIIRRARNRWHFRCHVVSHFVFYECVSVKNASTGIP